MSIKYNNKSYRKSSGRCGFSIIEVIVAMTVFGVSMIAIFGTMRTVSRAAYHARMQTKAVLLAESLLTDARLTKDTSYTTSEGTNERFMWEVLISPTPVEDLGVIRVAISWKEQQRDQKYELTSFLQMKSFGP